MTSDTKAIASLIARLAARLEDAPRGECNGNRCALIPAQVLAVIVADMRTAARDLGADTGWQTR